MLRSDRKLWYDAFCMAYKELKGAYTEETRLLVAAERADKILDLLKEREPKEHKEHKKIEYDRDGLIPLSDKITPAFASFRKWSQDRLWSDDQALEAWTIFREGWRLSRRQVIGVE